MLDALLAQMWDNHDHMRDSWGRGAAVFWLIVLALVVVLVVVLVRHFTHDGRGRGGGSSRSAHDILAERFARGEIDEEEYRKRKDVLSD